MKNNILDQKQNNNNKKWEICTCVERIILIEKFKRKYVGENFNKFHCSYVCLALEYAR